MTEPHLCRLLLNKNNDRAKQEVAKLRDVLISGCQPGEEIYEDTIRTVRFHLVKFAVNYRKKSMDQSV